MEPPIFCIFRALYGYEPQTNDLKVISTGDGGLEELNEDLNTSNIMYAFVRIQDPKTSLTKYVLINWQVIYLFFQCMVKYIQTQFIYWANIER